MTALRLPTNPQPKNGPQLKKILRDAGFDDAAIATRKRNGVFVIDFKRIESGHVNDDHHLPPAEDYIDRMHDAFTGVTVIGSHESVTPAYSFSPGIRWNVMVRMELTGDFAPRPSIMDKVRIVPPHKEVGIASDKAIIVAPPSSIVKYKPPVVWKVRGEAGQGAVSLQATTPKTSIIPSVTKQKAPRRGLSSIGCTTTLFGFVRPTQRIPLMNPYAQDTNRSTYALHAAIDRLLNEYDDWKSQFPTYNPLAITVAILDRLRALKSGQRPQDHLDAAICEVTRFTGNHASVMFAIVRHENGSK